MGNPEKRREEVSSEVEGGAPPFSYFLLNPSLEPYDGEREDSGPTPRDEENGPTFTSGRLLSHRGARLGEGVFAQLVARDVLLEGGLLHWYSDPGFRGVFLAPGLSYDEHTQELVVSEAGIYYVFLHVKLQRVVARAGSGSVSIALHLQPLGTGTAALALTLDLPSPTSETPDSASGFRGGLLHLGAGQRLGVYLSAADGVHPAWQLAQGATVLGLYQVATKVPAGFPSGQPS
ncbi:PREDICTED: tumor necrosis factor ligand superfamily member 9 [Miniopterus natalensis]|uniref:tumor necrosis factor ligand superfamily member 9 n=1 Tax=Miniopterus natalensis TaxID=291302 RepID=UPI0007A7159B|nr:PREDICTED: tumor necrosis factor ligand superfamily member 9 [Miniopterus natalensis]